MVPRPGSPAVWLVLGSHRVWFAASALLVLGCSADVVRDAEGATEGGGGGEAAIPSACDGALGRHPSLLASGLEESRLAVAGDHLVLGGESGRVVRLDRCGGSPVVLADFDAPVSVAIAGDSALVAVASPPHVVRVPLGGAPITTVADLPGPGRLAVLDDGRLFAVVSVPDATGGDEDGNDDVAVLAIDTASGVVTELRREELWLPGTWTLLGASAAGLYVSNGSYHGGNPGLLRVPLDGGPVTELEGTHGAVDVAVVDDHLVVAGEAEENGMGSGRMEIARLALDGSAREVLAPDSDAVGYVLRIAADPTLACWPGTGRIRCVQPTVGAPLQDLGPTGDGGGWVEDLAIAPDAVYWLRRRDLDLDGTTDDTALVAVAR